MDKKFTVAVLGCGNRGTNYTSEMLTHGGFKITAFCDVDKEQLVTIHSLYGLEDALDFTDPDEFLKEKRADLLIIATADRFHVPQGVKALKLGYDVLMEKPISDSREEIDLLLKTQQETGKHVIVCHELRYGAGFKKCAELIEQGKIGSLFAIEATERAVYWHWVQAYVRGVGASLEEGHPAILAKCSHDLDLIQSYAKSECDTVSSVGGLYFFKEENAPEGSTDRCVTCKHVDTCPYSAKNIYVDCWHRDGEPSYIWPYFRACPENPITEEGLMKGITEGRYGRCVFRCPVEKVDHQMVQMQFKNGVKATLTMTYGGNIGRRLAFYGTHGEIVFDERTRSIQVMEYGKYKTETIDVKSLLLEGNNAHGGGDMMLINELYQVMAGTKAPRTPLRESVECHLMGISAEESRLNGGKLVKVHKD
jgi:predicted dehydrogenase